MPPISRSLHHQQPMLGRAHPDHTFLGLSQEGCTGAWTRLIYHCQLACSQSSIGEQAHTNQLRELGQTMVIAGSSQGLGTHSIQLLGVDSVPCQPVDIPRQWILVMNLIPLKQLCLACNCHLYITPTFLVVTSYPGHKVPACSVMLKSIWIIQYW